MNTENPKDSSISPEQGSKRKESPEYVNVAVAIIEQDGKFLIGKRAPDKPYAGKWAFIGGRIEAGESPEEALRREVLEEIGMDVEIVRTLSVTDVNLPDGNAFRLHGFICRIIGWVQSPLVVHDELRWATAEELRGPDFLDSNKAILSRLPELAEEKRKGREEKPDDNDDEESPPEHDEGGESG
ncbi:MAG: (deoxy)nucleoside triphosphate pyrophosphohydrolase [Candidatus Sungbacteria bacterium]|nr:(deoxy)nucleoside triphosphate pyrophosphohydrolase [Candidatus Sungbacteria bacterium]